MTIATQTETKDHHEFYSTQYAKFGSALAAEIRREAYGVDLGQLSWRTLEEQAEIAELIKEQSPCRVLDIACGSGGPSLALSSSTGCRLTGVDIEEAAIEEAKQRSQAARLTDSSEFFVADCNQELPFEDDAFDMIVCIDAVLHLRDRFAALADWFRLLKPGGRLLFTDAAVLTGAVSKQELDIRASQGHCVLVPPGVNEKAIAQAGFRLRKQSNATASLADITHRLFTAREARSTALRKEEGDDWFAWRQSFLSTIENLAASGRLSRFLYVAETPTKPGQLSARLGIAQQRLSVFELENVDFPRVLRGEDRGFQSDTFKLRSVPEAAEDGPSSKVPLGRSIAVARLQSLGEKGIRVFVP